MRRRPNRPKGRRRLAPLVWLIWSSTAVAVLLSSAGLLAMRLTVPDQRVFPGRLRPTSEPTQIVLPADIPLKAVHVSEGQTVRSGETLATLDAEAITLRLTEIDVDILVRQILRDCLVDGAGLSASGWVKQDIVSVPEEADARAQDTATRVRQSLAECSVERREWIQRKMGLDEALALLRTRRDLLTKKITLALAQKPKAAEGPAPEPEAVPMRPDSFARTEDLTQVPLRPDMAPPMPKANADPTPSRLRVKPDEPPMTPKPPRDPNDQAQAVVAMALARTVLDERILELRRRIETEALAAERDRLTRAQELADESRDLHALRSILARHVATPRLTAPRDGTVARVRNTKPGATFPQAAELIALSPSEDVEVEATMALPANIAALIREGDPVSVRVRSQLRPGPPLMGRVGEASEVPPSIEGVDLVGFKVVLDEEMALAEARSGLAFAGRQSVAAVQVRLDSITVADTLLREGSALAATTALGQLLGATAAEAAERPSPEPDPPVVDVIDEGAPVLP